jgi:L-ascorbate metabolism protein UlaG (beta-lactamase superfamily)
MTSRTAPTDHFDGHRFFNPSGANGQPFYMVPRMMRTRRTPWPAVIPVAQHPPPALGDDALVATWIGHSTFLIQSAAANLLLDPVYSDRAGPFQLFGPRRVRRPAIAFDALPRIDLVLVSHCHYDHCDLVTLAALARRFDPPVVTLVGNAPLIRSAGIRHVQELDWWESAAGTAVRITATPAQHFSARSPFDRNRRLWGGFVVETAGRRIFFAADSGYAPFFGEVPRRCGPIDLALLPIGAYEPRWFMKDIHMNPAEAVQAHLDVAAAASVAMHFGTFPLTPEGIDEPVAALERALAERGVPRETFRVLDFGGSLRLDGAAR